MNKRFVIPLFIPLVLASCSLTILDDDTGDDELTFVVDKVTVYDASSHIKVEFTSEESPFAWPEHTYGYVNILGVKSEFIEYNPRTIASGFFLAETPNDKATSYTIDFYDTNNVAYLSVCCDDVSLLPDPDPKPDPKPDPDPVNPDYPTGYTTLAWSDEFDNASTLNTNWNYDIGTGGWGWGNGEMQYYRKENASVRDGNLVITAKRENYAEQQFTSARMVTRGIRSWKYGYIEARIKLPALRAMWPAFWMMPENSVYGGWPHSGEIDIMEAKGRISSKTSSAIHFSTLNGDHTYLTHEQTFANSYISDFHTYAVEWQKDFIQFLVDGQVHAYYYYNEWCTSGAPANNYAPFDQNFHIILNLAVGGQFDGWTEPASDFTSAEMLVDYVRVYQK